MFQNPFLTTKKQQIPSFINLCALNQEKGLGKLQKPIKSDEEFESLQAEIKRLNLHNEKLQMTIEDMDDKIKDLEANCQASKTELKKMKQENQNFKLQILELSPRQEKVQKKAFGKSSKTQSIIRISKLPSDACKEELEQIFSVCGNIQNVTVKKDLNDDSLLFATIEFEEAEAAKKAEEYLKELKEKHDSLSETTCWVR